MFGVNRSKVLTILCFMVVVFGIKIERSQSIAFPSGTIREEDYFKLKPKEGNNKLGKEYSNKEVIYGSEDDENQDSKLNEVHEKPVLRSQRIDHRNYKHHSKNENKLRSFHNNRNLQKNYLHKQENDFTLDYEAILDELLRNPDIFEDEMNIKDIGTSIGENRFEDLDQENMPLEELANRETNYKKKKFKANNHNNPVNYFDVKENLLAEKEYNKQFLNEPKLDDILGLNDDDIFQDLNLKLNQDSVKAHGSESVNSNPSMVNKQSNPTSDPTMDAKIDQIKKQNDSLFVFVVAGCTLAGVIALVAAGVCWYTVYRKSNDASYATKSGKLSPSGSLKSNSTSSGDRRLAQSAQMYHYQHQKQQMIAMEKANSEQKQEDSENSDGETEEGDYTVYECPGLAPTGEMEVKNPLFKEEFSSNNISQSAMPPAYSTIEDQTQEVNKNDQLIEIDENKQESDKNSSQLDESVTIQINESNATSKN